MKLISMVDYVLQQLNEKNYTSERVVELNMFYTYANFLKRNLELGMFVNEIEKIEYVKETGHTEDCPCRDCEKLFSDYEKNNKAWQKAEKKVLFKGWIYKEDKEYGNYITDGEIELTPMSNNKEKYFLHDEFIAYTTIDSLTQFEGIELTDNAIKLLTK